MLKRNWQLDESALLNSFSKGLRKSHSSERGFDRDFPCRRGTDVDQRCRGDCFSCSERETRIVRAPPQHDVSVEQEMITHSFLRMRRQFRAGAEHRSRSTSRSYPPNLPAPLAVRVW